MNQKTNLSFEMIIITCFASICLVVFYLTVSEFHKQTSSLDDYLQPNGKIFGADYLAMYTGGSLIKKNPDFLYDSKTQFSFQESLLGSQAKQKAGILYFVYPPHFARLLSLFCNFDYKTSYYAWTAFSLILATLSLVIAVNNKLIEKKYLPLVLICGIGFQPLIMECIAGGQTSTFGMITLALTIYLLRRNKHFLAGLCLSIGFYKPPLFLVLGFVMIVSRAWRITIGALCGAVILIIFVSVDVGISTLFVFFETASKYTYGQEFIQGATLPTNQGIGLYSLLFSSLRPDLSLMIYLFFIVAAVATLGFLGKKVIKLGGESLELWFGSLIAASLFLSPQMIDYDLSLMLIAFMCIFPSALKSEVLIPKMIFMSSVLGFYFYWLWDRIQIGNVDISLTIPCFIIFLFGTIHLLLINLKYDTRDYLNKRVT